MLRLSWFTGLCLVSVLHAQGPENVLVVVNQNSALSRTVGEYYVLRRHVPLANVCRIHAPEAEEIPRGTYDQQIAAGVAACLQSKHLVEKILYVVTTAGVPLRIAGSGNGMETTTAAVDSELTLLYSDLRGRPHRLPGLVPNPFFGSDAAFTHSRFPIYLVTRLAGYNFADIKGLVDRALAAKNTGKFVIDLKTQDNTSGNDWLRAAAQRLPKDRVVLDETNRVLLNEHNVIGYASWGSNDPQRTERYLNFEWLPGAILTEFVSFNARTFKMPPKEWTIGTWSDQKTYFAGQPQDLTADYVHEGVTGASGHVFEPFLQFTPRPDLLLPAYFKGRTLAESYYLAIRALSWQNIVIGDPLCSLGKP